MKITKEKNGGNLAIALDGRLDTTTAPELEAELGTLDGVENLEFDFNSLEYISTAGLRVLLAAQKIMNKNGTMVIKNASSDIMEVFEITGFIDILTVE